MKWNQLIPELTVSHIEKSKQFYIDILGFQLEYERKEEKFAFLSFNGSQIMLEEIHDDGWNVADLQYPFGRGVNFSIEVQNIEELYHCLIMNQYPLYRSIMTNRYQYHGKFIEQKEFLVQDPDGYLLRLTQDSDKEV